MAVARRSSDSSFPVIAGLAWAMNPPTAMTAATNPATVANWLTIDPATSIV